MDFAKRIIANTPHQAAPGQSAQAPEQRGQGGSVEWVAVKPYEYESDAKRMVILINPQDPFASSTSNLVFAAFTGSTLDFGVKWFIGGQDDTLSIKFADGLDLDQVNYFFNKHGVPMSISIREICYLLTGIEDGLPEGPGGAPVENPEQPIEQQGNDVPMQDPSLDMAQEACPNPEPGPGVGAPVTPARQPLPIELPR